MAFASPADDVYQTPEAFVADAFSGNAPPPAKLWIAGDLRDASADILGEAPSALRTRYWLQGERSAWILEAIGKERPITAGFVVDHGELEQARVLIYRESRGWEVSLPAFMAQFDGVSLTDDNTLDARIDNISGATLSVRSMQRMARLALLYDRAVREDG
ncbi:MAG: FMN-binding protein [Gammaproteobacteria bacterium]